MKAKELTDLAEVWLSERYTDATIVREFSVSNYGGALIDIAAITDHEIVGIEIKGEGDSPSRLPLQGHVYGRVASKMFLLTDPSIHEKCLKKKPQCWSSLSISEGKISQNPRYTSYSEPIYLICPYSLCGTLWKSELQNVAMVERLKFKKGWAVHELTNLIVNNLPAPKIREQTIKQLRKRQWLKPVLDLRVKHNEPTYKQGAPV